jgi:hypothetical protein
MVLRAQGGEDLFFAREALQGKLPKYVELLKFKVPVSCLFYRRLHNVLALHVADVHSWILV